MSDLYADDLAATHRGCAFVVMIAAAVAFLLTVGVVLAGIAVARREAENEAPPGYAGSPVRGRALVIAYGCTSCHEIPGLPPAGLVGPPLRAFATRAYIAGRFANEPIALQQWIRDPQSMKPDTAMPALVVNERDVRDIAAYLATLR